MSRDSGLDDTARTIAWDAYRGAQARVHELERRPW